MESSKLHKLLGKAYRMHEKRSLAELSKINITPGQYCILNYLSRHDGCIQKDLSLHCGLEPSVVTNMLSGMLKSGLVRRESDASDRRAWHVLVTERGVQFHRQAEEILTNIDSISLEGFSDREKALFQSYLIRMYHNLKKAEKQK